MGLRLAALAAALGLAACAATPDYVRAPREDAPGYSDQRIESGRYRVRYQGRSSQRLAEVQDLALLRAAELTLNQRASWFRVVSRDTEQTGEPRRSGVRFGVGAGGAIGGGGYGGVSLGTGTGGSRGSAVAILEILMGTGDKPEGADVYDAAEVFASLKPKA